MIAFADDYQSTNTTTNWSVDYGGLTTAVATIRYEPQQWWFEEAPAPKTKTELKAERKAAYRAVRHREARTELHFAGELRPSLPRRESVDPLRHQRQRGWRLASRRDQTQRLARGTG